MAQFTVGQIDWNPYLPLIFSRVQQMFSLPTKFNKTSVGGRASALDCNAAARLIVYTMGGTKSQTKIYLSKLFSSLESYFHPANIGRSVCNTGLTNSFLTDKENQCLTSIIIINNFLQALFEALRLLR